MLKILCLQRESLVARGVPSLSVAARITEALDYLVDQRLLEFISIGESDAVALQALQWADVLMMSKHNTESALSLAITAKKLKKKIVYDLDDWIFSFPSYSGARNKEIRSSEIAKEIIALSDVVSVANETLQTAAKSMIGETVLIPNGMYIEKYFPSGKPVFPDQPSNRIVFTNADLLKIVVGKQNILSALQEFFMDKEEYILDFFGDPFPEVFTLPFLHFTRRVPYERYLRLLLTGQYKFGIVPLGAEEDSESVFFNSCKNPFKYLNYGMAGIPGIYSNAPIYRPVVTSGLTGLLVNNDKQSWLHALHQLSEDADGRKRMREAAFSDVVDNHHIKKAANMYLEIIATGV